MNNDHSPSINWHDVIEANPLIANGRPMVKGTDLTVEAILQELAQGQTIAATIQKHPELSHETMRALFRFARHHVHNRYPGPTSDSLFVGPEWTLIEF